MLTTRVSVSLSLSTGMRSLGSAALNFCAVASGQLDAYWEIGCWEWDVCGGAIIAQEAGGRLFGSKESSLDGEPTADVLTGRKYLVVRGGAGGLEEQKKLARSFYSYVEEWDQV
jgi:myo-inositol-1(or 4)-monophosphatase